MRTPPSSEPITDGARQAYQVLQVAFIIVPIIAGVDRFLDKLANWDMYLAPVGYSHSSSSRPYADDDRVGSGNHRWTDRSFCSSHRRLDCGDLVLVDHHQPDGRGWFLR